MTKRFSCKLDRFDVEGPEYDTEMIGELQKHILEKHKEQFEIMRSKDVDPPLTDQELWKKWFHFNVRVQVIARLS